MCWGGGSLNTVFRATVTFFVSVLLLKSIVFFMKGLICPLIIILDVS